MIRSFSFPLNPRFEVDPVKGERVYYCDYNRGLPCDYTGVGGKGYCDGCCRCPY